MYINETELSSAIQETQKKYTHFVLDPDRSRSLIIKVGNKKERLPFGEAIRYSLNELEIWDKKIRPIYSCLIGKYYGRHGGYVAAKRRKEKLPNKEVLPPVDIEILPDKNGQYTANF